MSKNVISMPSKFNQLAIFLFTWLLSFWLKWPACQQVYLTSCLYEVTLREPSELWSKVLVSPCWHPLKCTSFPSFLVSWDLSPLISVEKAHSHLTSRHWSTHCILLDDTEIDPLCGTSASFWGPEKLSDALQIIKPWGGRAHQPLCPVSTFPLWITCVWRSQEGLASLGSLRGWVPKICFLTLLHLFWNGDHLEKMTWGSSSETVQPQSLLPSSQALLLLPQPKFWKTILG